MYEGETAKLTVEFRCETRQHVPTRLPPKTPDVHTSTSFLFHFAVVVFCYPASMKDLWIGLKRTCLTKMAAMAGDTSGCHHENI